MPDTTCAELEIGLHRWNIDSYSVELRLTPPGPDGAIKVKIVHGIRFDFAGLRAHALDPVAYGQCLTEHLFRDRAMGEAFVEAASQAAALRLRLFVGPNVPELHALRWETLRDPRSGQNSWLVTSQSILFARYLSSTYLGHQGVRLRPRSELSALVVVANPTSLDQYAPNGRPLAPIDVAGEVARATESLGDAIPVTACDSGGTATLANLCDHMRQGCDILYLICHGALIDDQPVMWLEKEDGSADIVTGDRLIANLRDLRQLPRLVVLASCQSAGTGDVDGGGFEQALGSRLAGAGVAAVLAMQGEISQETVARFMPTFFEELQQDGMIDRAMAVARGAVRERPDSWMPVLFMRPRTGLLWYVPGFGESTDFERWPALSESIRRQECTPIIGPGLHESLIGSPREIARQWAEEFGFPLAPDDRDDLPQVAQYLAVRQKTVFLRSAFKRYIHDRLRERYRDDLPAEFQEADDSRLFDLIAAVGEKRRAENPADPHLVLAELDMPVFITTSPGNMLAEALRSVGKAPETEISRWNRDTIRAPSVFEREPAYEPSVQRPLIYHVFGHFDVPASLVLTEDNYFDYLIGLTRNEDLIPSQVVARLTNSALLFLGFQMNDWMFRVLFRTIVRQEGGAAREDYAHVAVQVDPTDDRIVDPRRARRYLEQYFLGEDVAVYWGSADDFAEELQRRAKGNGR